ncbi:lipoprotein-anchoring transpeptidase ErfK/SrfK [Angulomicrobium tetraedrale]|uniref:Lipoprotein-anchoring transpeptidase ErfK/SrfK n=1 Tax=Ancylobacter tetraedralis TaxID=217068 RepID=A0A839ZGH1_9HYPH|nr:L,D-transpeptidase [Ancylobacter tetraedralis]MBB3773943.1 lipoprotein-anchoring transpeptidase ErfK/SrfK [Ancylobacter tetraedralis]
MRGLDRRAVLGFSLAGVALALGGCQRTTTASAPLSPVSSYAAIQPMNVSPASNYGPVNDRFPVEAFDTSEINPIYLRREVPYTTTEAPGTIVIDPREHFLYYVMPGGTAMRYGVGVGKEGFSWSGTATINSKQEWPDWYPPKEMIDRRPDIKSQLSQLQSGQGVAGGLRNPLGARAMYLWQNGKDTLYRIHGTLEPNTIGTNVSSGCIRMINQDAIDLYSRVTVGTKVVVQGSRAGA